MVASVSLGGQQTPVAMDQTVTNRRIVLAIAVSAAGGMVVAAPSPTGARTIDIALMLIAGTASVWCAASAPWWAIALGATVAAGAAPTTVLAAVAIAAVFLAYAIGSTRTPAPWAPTIAVGIIMQVLARLGNVHAFAISSAIGIAVMAALSMFGLASIPQRRRRWTMAIVAGLGLSAVLAAVSFGLAARSARPALEQGNRQAHQGISELAKGDIAAARASFTEAAASFARADGDMGGLMAQPARLVPGVAQNRNAVADLTSGASNTSHTIAEELAAIDLDSLRVVHGRIDIGAIRSLEQPLRRLNLALDELDHSVAASDSPWLAGPLRRKLLSLQGDIDTQRVRGENALAAVQQAPALLGEGGQRVYFIAFTTPAEARGLGGFMGNFAELTITDGSLDMTRFGRTGELNQAGIGARVTGPPDWLARYGRLGFTNQPGGVAGNTAWSNITVSPDFPSTAQVISELYPQSGGRHVDGVISIDAAGIAGLIKLTGPIAIPGLDRELTADNAADFILRDQYQLADGAGRQDLLDTIARTTVEQLLGGTIPGPVTVGKVLGPLASQGRITMWTEHPAERAMLHDIGMLGELPVLDGGDGLAITVNNAAPNKIDVYAGRDISYNARQDPATGTVSAELTVVLTNTAPEQGLPELVAGNAFGLPAGANRMYLSVYTPLQMTAVSLDGTTIGMESAREGAWHVYSQIVEVPPGGRRTLSVRLNGTLAAHRPYSFTARPQPLVIPETWTIDVLDPAGRPVAAFHGPLQSRRTIVSSP